MQEACFYKEVGDAENLSKATICRSIRKVYLPLKGIMNIFITFPGHKRTCYIKEEFYKITGGPNMNYRLQNCVTVTVGDYSLFSVPGFLYVIGALDCDVVNRKSFHISINVQVRTYGCLSTA